MAIGRPISLTDNVGSKTLSVLATSGQTVFTVAGGYRINKIGVFRNGVRLSEGTDFTALDGSTVTLLYAAALNDEIVFEIQDDFRVADAIVSAASDQVISGNLTVTGTVTGASVGIQSGGTVVGTAKTLNFVGAGNTFEMDGDTVNVTISSGGGGGGIGTAINYSDDVTATPFTYIDKSATIEENLLLDATNSGGGETIIVSVIPNIEVSSGVAMTVGVGKTMVIDVLQIGDL